MQFNSGLQPSLSVGGYTFTDVKNLLIIGTWVTSAGNNGTFKTAAKVAYTPSGSKTFRILAIRLVPSTNSTTRARLGYGDNDVGYNSGTPPSNASTAYDLAGSSGFTIVSGAPNAAGQVGPGISEQAINYVIPNGKYPFMVCDNGGFMLAFGYEE